MSQSDEITEWEAVAREHGGVAVYLHRPDLEAEVGGRMLEPAILKTQDEQDGFVSVRLSDPNGSERVMFLVQRRDLDGLP